MRKKMKKRLISFVAVFIVALMAASPVMGATKTLSVPYVSQTENEKCCWACAGTMVCKYYGIGITKEQFIYAVRGTTDTSIGGTASEIAYGLNCYGLSAAKYTNSDFDYSKLVNNINLGKPVIGSGYTNGYDHAFVYVGYQYDGTLPLNGKVIINDSSLGMRLVKDFNQFYTSDGYYSEQYIVAS